jgi:protein phosphatase
VLGAAAERALPAVGTTGGSGSGADEDDEDEAHGATALTAASPSVTGEDEARYNPQPPHQRRVRRPLAIVLVVLLVVVAAAGTAYAWGRTQYFVGAAGEQVAIYQGLPETIVVPLSRVFEIQPVAVAGLPAYYQDMVRGGIEVSGLTAARRTVAELTETARRCSRNGSTPTPQPTGSVSPSVKTSPSAKAGPSSSASPVPTVRPSESATAEPGC